MRNIFNQGEWILIIFLGLVLTIGTGSWRFSAISVTIIIGLYRLLNRITKWEIKKAKGDNNV